MIILRGALSTVIVYSAENAAMCARRHVAARCAFAKREEVRVAASPRWQVPCIFLDHCQINLVCTTLFLYVSNLVIYPLPAIEKPVTHSLHPFNFRSTSRQPERTERNGHCAQWRKIIGSQRYISPFQPFNFRPTCTLAFNCHCLQYTPIPRLHSTILY
jgi:hypothetical protein